jgi:hypothetical protein
MLIALIKVLLTVCTTLFVEKNLISEIDRLVILLREVTIDTTITNAPVGTHTVASSNDAGILGALLLPVVFTQFIPSALTCSVSEVTIDTTITNAPVGTLTVAISNDAGILGNDRTDTLPVFLVSVVVLSVASGLPVSKV